jgi:hypothetical protein
MWDVQFVVWDVVYFVVGVSRKEEDFVEEVYG